MSLNLEFWQVVTILIVVMLVNFSFRLYKQSPRERIISLIASAHASALKLGIPISFAATFAAIAFGWPLYQKILFPLCFFISIALSFYLNKLLAKKISAHKKMIEEETTPAEQEYNEWIRKDAVGKNGIMIIIIGLVLGLSVYKYISFETFNDTKVSIIIISTCLFFIIFGVMRYKMKNLL